MEGTLSVVENMYVVTASRRPTDESILRDTSVQIPAIFTHFLSSKPSKIFAAAAFPQPPGFTFDWYCRAKSIQLNDGNFDACHGRIWPGVSENFVRRVTVMGG